MKYSIVSTNRRGQGVTLIEPSPSFELPSSLPIGMNYKGGRSKAGHYSFDKLSREFEASEKMLDESLMNKVKCFVKIQFHYASGRDALPGISPHKILAYENIEEDFPPFYKCTLVLMN